jgi:hypothetical protein
MWKPPERQAAETATAPGRLRRAPVRGGAVLMSLLALALLPLPPLPCPRPGPAPASIRSPLQVAGRSTWKSDSGDDDDAGFRWSPSKPATTALPRLHGLKGLLSKPASTGDYQTEHIEHFWQLYHGRNTAEKTKPLEREK